MTRNIPILPYIIVKNDNFSITFGTTIIRSKNWCRKILEVEETFLLPWHMWVWERHLATMTGCPFWQLFLVPFGQQFPWSPPMTRSTITKGTTIIRSKNWCRKILKVKGKNSVRCRTRFGNGTGHHDGLFLFDNIPRDSHLIPYIIVKSNNSQNWWWKIMKVDVHGLQVVPFWQPFLVPFGQ